MPTSTSPKFTVVIIDAGPAGLAAFLPMLVEAGSGLAKRMAAEHTPQAPDTVVNGLRGAGLYSDCKISTLPAGSGQLSTNPHELRDSNERVLSELGVAIPAQSAKTLECLGDNTVLFKPTPERPLETPFQPRRLEIGVRVDVASHPPLHRALVELSRNNDMVFDPKLKLRRTCVIDGRSVECEFRTFCVCVPSDYMVRSHDTVSGVQSFSGSSSFAELCCCRRTAAP